jgi:hypothetical protein
MGIFLSEPAASAKLDFEALGAAKVKPDHAPGFPVDEKLPLSL